MGNDHRPAGPLYRAFAALLTPHGERSRHSHPGACRGSSPPNPSWGTITEAVAPRHLLIVQLLTPHGERSRPVGDQAHDVVILLTPHGERSLRQTGTASAGRTPPNPSWGTITPAEPGRGEPKQGLLTPHGERSRASSRLSRARSSPPNPSWGTITRSVPSLNSRLNSS